MVGGFGIAAGLEALTVGGPRPTVYLSLAFSFAA
jgi:hypothetical protein